MKKNEIDRFPFGIPGLDKRFGGVPVGSFVLLSGNRDSGVHEFVYTSSSALMTAKHDPETFSVFHGKELDDRSLPNEVHYVSLSRSEENVLDSMNHILNDEMYDTLVEHMKIHDFSQEFMSMVPVPRSLTEETFRDMEIEDIEKTIKESDEEESEILDEEYGEFLDEVSDTIEDVASKNVVVLDSLTDLVSLAEFDLDWRDIFGFLIGLRKACTRWNCVMYVILDRVGSTNDYEEIASIPDGTIVFDVEESKRTFERTMHVGSFRGLISKEEQVRFETKVTDDGFEISYVRKM